VRTNYLTGTIDARNVDRMLEKLKLEGKEGKKVIKNSCRVALEMINEETSDKGSALKLKPSGLGKRGWRATLKKRSAYIYRNRRNRAGRFWFYSAINYKKPILRLSHLIEKGFKHVGVGFVAGNWFRDKAFRKKRSQALDYLNKNLLYGMKFISTGKKVPNLTQYRKGVRK